MSIGRLVTVIAVSLGGLSWQASATEYVCSPPASAPSVGERRIEVRYETEKNLPCKTYYFKHDVEEQVAWAENTEGLCEDVANTIRVNLEKGGFACAETPSDASTE